MITMEFCGISGVRVAQITGYTHYKCNMTGAIIGAGIAYPAKASEFTPGF
jgi:hypothetical protein